MKFLFINSIYKLKGIIFRKILMAISAIIKLIYNFLPYKISFMGIVYVNIISGRAANFLAKRFIPYVSNSEIKNNRVYNNFFVDMIPYHKAWVLFYMGRYNEVIDIVTSSMLFMVNPQKIFQLTFLSYFELADFKKLNEIAELASFSDKYYIKAIMALLNKDESTASRYLILNNNWCPHQNIAALYPDNYSPTITDKKLGKDALLFDAYNYLGQRVIHIGEGDMSNEFYIRSFNIQTHMKKNLYKPSKKLREWLAVQNISPDSFHIVAWEWFTQIGHMGLLEVLFRMKSLGRLQGHIILLLPPHNLIANKFLLSLFKSLGLFVSIDLIQDKRIYHELFSLQRCLGLSFNAWQYDANTVVQWQQAAVKTIKQWDKENRPCLLKQIFDSMYYSEHILLRHFKSVKNSWGMNSNDWYVCLHIRDGAFYSEIDGLGQTHRNAQHSTYHEAIKFITNAGGWVIKLGSKKSQKLSKLSQTVDYTRSKFKSDILDILLIRYSRIFIGTTSGLTNIAIGFGLPCALVNCITTDVQLWNISVRFILKYITVGNKNLTQHELTSSPWRWRCFSMDVLRRHNAVVKNNSSDEILEVVKEVYYFTEKSDQYLKKFPNRASLISEWKRCLEIEDYYGNALPSLYFLQKNERIFLKDQVDQLKEYSHS